MTMVRLCDDGVLLAKVESWSYDFYLLCPDLTCILGSILRYAEDWELMPGLNDESIAPLVARITDKTTYNAFIHTSLEESLRAHGVDTVVVTGTLTNLCCETTARDAFCRNFEVVVVSDGCAAETPKHHQMALENLEFGFADVREIKQIMEDVEKL